MEKHIKPPEADAYVSQPAIDVLTELAVKIVQHNKDRDEAICAAKRELKNLLDLPVDEIDMILNEDDVRGPDSLSVYDLIHTIHKFLREDVIAHAIQKLEIAADKLRNLRSD